MAASSKLLIPPRPPASLNSGILPRVAEIMEMDDEYSLADATCSACHELFLSSHEGEKGGLLTFVLWTQFKMEHLLFANHC